MKNIFTYILILTVNYFDEVRIILGRQRIKNTLKYCSGFATMLKLVTINYQLVYIFACQYWFIICPD